MTAQRSRVSSPSPWVVSDSVLTCLYRAPPAPGRSASAPGRGTWVASWGRRRPSDAHRCPDRAPGASAGPPAARSRSLEQSRQTDCQRRTDCQTDRLSRADGQRRILTYSDTDRGGCRFTIQQSMPRPESDHRHDHLVLADVWLTPLAWSLPSPAF